MRKLFWSCVALFAVAAFTHPIRARAFEPVWLTDKDLDQVTAGSMLISTDVSIAGLVLARTLDATSPAGMSAVTSSVIGCAQCSASISVSTTINVAGTSSIVTSSAAATSAVTSSAATVSSQ